MDASTDRRTILTTSALLGVLGAAEAVDMTSSAMDSRAALHQVEAGLESLARRWETTAPADLVERLATLEHHARTIGRWRLGSALRRDWIRAHGRILLMTSVAQGDNGMARPATVSARAALVLAKHVGDATTAAHAGVVLAELAAYSFQSTRDGLALARAAQATAPHAHTAVLAMTTEAHIMAACHLPTDDIVAVLRSAGSVAAKLPAGAVGYSLDGIHPGYLPTFGGAALVAAGALDEGNERLSEAAELFDRSRASGALAAVRLYQTSAAMRARELDKAEILATRALAASAVRPSSWLSNGILFLAERARSQGADWSGLVIQAQEWSPL
ncbi:hypothetical protein ThrDRAFT_01385 [Frankia casuarinae]|jgi:hypothetical protein|uniref:Uncharacterized protein n=1 Tax=Frankia casuarinae (strain DSM 45818 / CECT 9043 / HFP020203 / CcI3) TaxID=106370 RepID=Q2JG32_FRACC|nr:hypothetical protein [Frankia casuarinae]ABD09760.1 hypothetical protein Francci3_0373 [Frankia casuarinae]EYT93002.1 hypothetical protein ThrDRAFT_01385 [Frankia casuarinae]